MDKGVETFAKMIVDNGGTNPCGMYRQDFEGEIVRRAERRDGESAAQSFTRFITTDDVGKLLFKAAMLAPPRAANPKPAVQDLKRIQAGEATRDLEALAQEMADKMKVSREKAYTALWTDPRRAELVAAVKQEERDLAEWMKTQREPTQEAYDQYRRDWRLGRSLGSARM
jgi:hypothetical protein